MERLKASPIWAATLLLAMGLGAGVARAAPPEGPTFDQVTAAPDDAKLDVAYARERAGSGHLLEAAAALERVLIAQPDQADVRLFYAVVLYRLDDLQNAEEQLKLVDPKALSPLQKREYDRYRRLVGDRRKHGLTGVRIGGQVAAGIAYDSNAAGALLTQVDFFGFNPPLKKAGSGAVVSGDIHASVPLTGGEGLSLIGSLSGYDRETIGGGAEQLQTFDGRLGLAYATAQHTVSVTGVARTWRLLDTHYLDEFGGRFETSWRPTTSTTVAVSVEGVQQNYNLPLLDPLVKFGNLEGNADGARYDVELDLTHRFGARNTVFAGVGYENKLAGYRAFGYQAPYLQGSWNLALPRGTYVNASGAVHFMHYGAVDDFFLGSKRKDTQGSARLALGAPFSAFTREGATGDFRENLAVEAAATYSSRESRAPITDYQDYGAELRLIWRFGAHD